MPQPDQNPSPSELQIALDNRAFEIQLFWQRTNYFLVLITALGIGVFSISDNFFSLLIAILGVCSSFLWFRTNLGSKFWQESWEIEVESLADEFGIKSFQRDLDDIERQVTESLRDGERNAKKSRYEKWLDGLTLKKYSVTRHMITLSLISSILWFCIVCVIAFRLVRPYFY